MQTPDIRLLVTDLDGTVMGHRDDRSLYPSFKQLLDELRRSRQLQWVICTGRSFSGYRKFAGSLERAGIRPDFVVTGRFGVFKRTPDGYRFEMATSLKVGWKALRAPRRERALLKRLHRELLNSPGGVRKVLQLPDRFAVRFATREAAEEAMALVERSIREHPALQSRRDDREITVFQRACQKGGAIRFLAREWGIAPARILAVDDSRDDLCLLDRRVAGHVGCPLNADEDVHEAVRGMDGHISERFTLAGVMDVITATLEGRVSSVIPENPPELPRRRRSHARHSSSTSHRRTHLARNYLLGSSVVGITLVVFANYGLIPFSGVIMQPIYLILRVAEKLWIWLT